MAVDVQCVFTQAVIQLNSVRELAGSNPRTIDVLGADFSSVDEVYINGEVSPDVVVLSKRRLLAQVPSNQLKQSLGSVSVVSNQLAATEKSLLRFRFGKTPSKVSGVLRLVQVFLKILFTTPGKDIFAPRIGAGALKNIGTTFGREQGGNVVSEFIVAVATAQRQLVAIQSRDPSIPLDERLLMAKIRSAAFNRVDSALLVTVELTSQAGRSALANIAV